MKSVEVKFLILIGIFTSLFSFFLLYRTYAEVKRYVKEEVEKEVAIQLKFDLAIRQYIAEKVRPIMYSLVGKDEFIPETMSTSYVARSIFEEVRKEFPDNILKFSSDNPRNPANQAGPEELKMIEYFNNNPQVEKWTGDITLNGKEFIAKFSARRMEESCLPCHGDPADAPSSLLEKYGSTAGFHRPMNEVIGLDTVAVPMSKISKQLRSELIMNFIVLGTGLVMLFFAVLISFRFVVTNRLKIIIRHFQSISDQNSYSEIKPLEVKGRDEISILSRSFNTLAHKLKDSYDDLEEQVKKRTKDLNETNERIETILFSLPTGIVICDMETKKIIDANPKAISMIESPLSRIVDSKCDQFISRPEGGEFSFTDIGQALAYTLIAGAVLVYHGLLLRSDQHLLEEQKLEGQRRLYVAIVDSGNGRLGRLLSDHLQAQLPGLNIGRVPLTKTAREAMIVESQQQTSAEILKSADIIVSPWQLANEPAEEFIIDDEISDAYYQSQAHKLMLPRPQRGVTWIGVEPWQEKAIANEVEDVINQIAKGESPAAARRMSTAVIVLLVLASLFGLLILLPLVIQLLSLLIGF